MTGTPFDLDEWLKDKSRKVVDAEGNPVEILAIPIAAQFYEFVPMGIDPTACVTYHLHYPGSKNFPVLGSGVHNNLFIIK